MKHPLTQHIKSKGAITVEEYMRLALMHPEYGYYQKQQAIGAAGDFITAPEITQIFGEMVGIWAAEQWIKMGKPKCALVELGPGRGTLMKDLLRATKHIAEFQDSIEVHLIEASLSMRAQQQQTLAGERVNIHWSEHVENLPDKPMLVIANEFFDALPIRQFKKIEKKWFERHVVWNEQKSMLEFTLTPIGNLLNHPLPNPPPSREWANFIEINESSQVVMQALSTHVARNGGAMLIIDYGYEGGSVKDTLQAVKNHLYANILETPGEADITAHVDFDQLASIATTTGLNVQPIITQRDFLISHGAEIRAEQLCKALDGVQKKSIIDGLSRLTSPEQMGTLFKVLICCGPLVSISGKL
jgi:NADH dehydrogenase [ubiquinone] 1 alpha subcomplex assembly factor 7